MKEQYSLTSENVVENTAVLSLLGASTNENVNALYPLAAACFVIILIAGIFMISSCMNSNVAQRTEFFGMMRCIGASKQQIVRFVRLEALNWCKTAIPIGWVRPYGKWVRPYGKEVKVLGSSVTYCGLMITRIPGVSWTNKG